ncbi:MAG: hypothetical protein HXY40_16710 [Chloroflexi bacterium]|nr:hypothetical protein [Chloroflexota bacterium]
MGLRVSWHNSHTLRCECMGHWNWSGFELALADLSASINSVSFVVDVILDVMPGAALPEGALLHLTKVLAQLRNHGRLVVLTSDAPTRQMVKAFRFHDQAADRPLLLATSMAEIGALLTRAA